VTVIAAGFDRYDVAAEPRKASMSKAAAEPAARPVSRTPGLDSDLLGAVPARSAQKGHDVFDVGGDDDLDLDDDFDVPSFLR